MEFKIEKRDNNWKTITDNRLEIEHSKLRKIWDDNVNISNVKFEIIEGYLENIEHQLNYFEEEKYEFKMWEDDGCWWFNCRNMNIDDVIRFYITITELVDIEIQNVIGSYNKQTTDKISDFLQICLNRHLELNEIDKNQYCV